MLAATSYFVFVPGPHDPCGNTFPRNSIPDFFISGVKNKVKRAIFATNPCRSLQIIRNSLVLGCRPTSNARCVEVSLSHLSLSRLCYCRIKYYTQEIVIFREDLLKKLLRNVLLPPNLENEDENITKHVSRFLHRRERGFIDLTTFVLPKLIRTVLDQSHLCPLPLQKQPIYWAHDHALRLYPMPDVVCSALPLLSPLPC